MRLIYNGAKLRDEYCLALIKYLYKLYHKKEYNRIKRFSRISAREILDVVNDNEDGSLDSAIGRVLGMCHFMNIKEDEMCIILYHALNEHRITWLQYIDDDDIGIDVLNLDKELIKECSAQIDNGIMTAFWKINTGTVWRRISRWMILWKCACRGAVIRVTMHIFAMK